MWLHVLMGGMVALYVVYGFVSYWRSSLAGAAGHRLIFDLRRDLYLHVQRMSLAFFERQRIGAIVARLTADIASAQNFVGAAFVNTAMDLAAIGAIVILLAVWHW
jgi:subfamily B ATP-binding cassette protein MsbA